MWEPSIPNCFYFRHRMAFVTAFSVISPNLNLGTMLGILSETCKYAFLPKNFLFKKFSLVCIKGHRALLLFSVGSEQILFSTLWKGISVVSDLLLINLLMTLQVPLMNIAFFLSQLTFKTFSLETTVVRIDLISHFLKCLH